MAEYYETLEAKVETKEAMRERVSRVLGTNQPSVFDVIDRSKFADDDSYLDALVVERMRRDTPEYQRTRREIEREYASRRKQAEKAENQAAYKQIRAEVSLDSMDHAAIDAEATEMARRDLAAGRISSRDLGKQISVYAEALGEKRKDSKAAGAMFNRMLRSGR